MKSETILKLDNIKKSYGSNNVLRGLNLSVLDGEIYGFLGQNGAGKTTTLRILLGLLKPDHGTVTCLGKTVQMYDTFFHEDIGVMSENSYIQPGLTVDEYILFFQSLYRNKISSGRIDELLGLMELSSHRNKQAVTLSNGMKKKLSLVRALVNEPKLLILDEPVSNLDPQSIVQVRKVLLEEKQRGCSIIMSSHILAEVEKIADRVGIIREGTIVAEKTIEDLENDLKINQKYILETKEPIQDHTFLKTAHPEILFIESSGNKLTLGLEKGADYTRIASDIIAAGAVITLAELTRPDLETSFLNIINKAENGFKDE